MITIILSAIIFGVGGWFSIYTCFSIYHFYDYIPTNVDYSFAVFGGGFLGFMIGLVLSICLSKFVTFKYTVSPAAEKFTLYPLSSDWQTYLVTNDNGDITYCGPGENVRTARKDEVERVEVKISESPYFIESCPERDSFWGLFATASHKPHLIFVVPRKTMIKKGWVDIITTTSHKLVLES